MRIKKQALGLLHTNGYIGINDETKEAFVIDPGADEVDFREFCEVEGYALKGILLTHGHFDHIGGVKAMVERYGCPVYASEAEREILANASVNFSTSLKRAVAITAYTPIQDGDVLEVAGIKIKVIETPGHTVGGVCYYVEEQGVLFSGDTLFLESIGITDFPTGNFGDIIHSIKEKLFALPEDTIVYPGHMDETTIEHEKKYNPFVR